MNFVVLQSAARHELALGNTYVSKNGIAPPKSEVDPKVWSIQFVFKRSHLLRPGYSIREKRILLSVCNVRWDENLSKSQCVTALNELCEHQMLSV